MIEDVNIFPKPHSRGLRLSVTWEGGPWKRSVQLRASGDPSKTTTKDQKLGCNPPVKPGGGASWRSAMEEIDDEMRRHGEGVVEEREGEGETL